MCTRYFLDLGPRLHTWTSHASGGGRERDRAHARKVHGMARGCDETGARIYRGSTAIAGATASKSSPCSVCGCSTHRGNTPCHDQLDARKASCHHWPTERDTFAWARSFNFTPRSRHTPSPRPFHFSFLRMQCDKLRARVSSPAEETRLIVAGFSIFAPKFEFTIGERLVGILRSFCIEFRCETKIVGAASIWNVCRRDLFNFRNFTSSVCRAMII